MEWRIGEIFKYNGEWYQCVVAIQGCRECSFRTHDYCTRHLECLSDTRSDGISVIFKKLEKIKEPPCKSCYFGMVQLYKLPYWNNGMVEPVGCHFTGDGYVLIEIKQKEEDMEEKKLNLKPFDIQKAREGKPVCTRDGRKTRIVCFNRVDADNKCNIVALIERDGEEIVRFYDELGNQGGNNLNKDNYDLMMLPEKKEGWVNVYKMGNEYICENECNVSTGIAVYKSEGEAKRNIDKNEIYVNTIKITWEE